MNQPLIKPVDIIKSVFLNADNNTLDSIELEDINYHDATDELVNIEENAYTLFNKAVADIKTIRKRYPIVFASSFGKDSTLLVLAGLEAHLQLINEGFLPQDAKFHITSIDTLVENHLMKMLVLSEVDKLLQFAKDKNINIDIRIGTPALAHQWSPMFLSGLKVLSLAKMNNDCSSSMKVLSAQAIEKQLEKEYDGQIITMLGSRILESTARKNSLERRNQAEQTAEQLIEFTGKNREDKVFAPIKNMSDDEVWLLLRRAGSNPITPPSKGYESIPSYTENHSLLNVIYADASEGSCPVSAKKITGDKKAAGGCGSARTGCNICLKIQVDSSAEAQAKSVRHRVINGNILKVRNYMMFIGSSIEHRSWHTRAIDMTTGAIAAQPNVLNAKTLDKLMNMMCNVTIDEIIRAEIFAEKVKRGDEMDDAGYADIFADNGMSDTEKKMFAQTYLKYAVKPLVTPITWDNVVYLSAVHSRDGIKLAPYRAIHLWVKLVEDFYKDVKAARSELSDSSLEKAYLQVRKEYEKKGIRELYPEVDPTKGVNDTIPDAVMIIPDYPIQAHGYVPHAGGLDLEQADGCTVSSREEHSKVPFKIAKRIIPQSELAKMSEFKNSDMVTIAGFSLSNTPLISMFADKPREKKCDHKFSKRSIKKVSRKNKVFRVLERGRTSLATPSFGERTGDVSLRKSLVNDIQFLLPSEVTVYEPFLSVDEESANGYEIDYVSLCQWEDYDGLENALKSHDRFIEGCLKWNDHSYFYSGAEPFESLMRWGVLDLKNKSRLNTMKILNRTSYFNTLGLFQLDDEKFAEYAKQESAKETFGVMDLEKIKSPRTCQKVRAKRVLPMNLYRSYKAEKLLAIRAERNVNRKNLKNRRKSYLSNPVDYSIGSIKSSLTDMVSYGLGEVDYLTASMREEQSFTAECEYTEPNGNVYSMAERKFFVDRQPRVRKLKLFLNYIYSYTSDLSSAYELMPSSVAKVLKLNPQKRNELQEALNDINDNFVNAIKLKIDACVEEMYSNANNSNLALIKAIPSLYKVSESSVIYNFDDSPAQIKSDIQW